MPVVEFALEIKVPKEILLNYTTFAMSDHIRVSRKVTLAFPPMVGVSYFGDGGPWEMGPIKSVSCDIDSETYYAAADLCGFQVKTEQDFVQILKHIGQRNWDTSQLSEKMLEIVKKFSKEAQG